ncbi:hypothetical protein Purlil1_283 [Purpureocillium lilacinum]|uniref:Uncharacterized protein n=1 Tax=Purpureocillium lilacinum TaxID=33203 RepID=A0ABR0CH85_PURLI|nr:hypothetical protein Purlil1_283 [Purpureocillium lilacinum]
MTSNLDVRFPVVGRSQTNVGARVIRGGAERSTRLGLLTSFRSMAREPRQAPEALKAASSFINSWTFAFAASHCELSPSGPIWSCQLMAARTTESRDAQSENSAGRGNVEMPLFIPLEGILPEQPYKVRLLRTSNADKTMRLTSSRNLLAGSCLPKPELPLPLPLRAPKRHDPVLPVPAKVLVMEAFPMPYKIRSRGSDFGYSEGSGGGPSTCPATRGIPLPRVSPSAPAPAPTLAPFQASAALTNNLIVHMLGVGSASRLLHDLVQLVALVPTSYRRPNTPLASETALNSMRLVD